MDNKSTPLPQSTFDTDVAAVGLNDVLDDGQAEARATQFATAGLVDPVEPFEKSGQMFLGDAGAPVNDFYTDFPCLTDDGNTRPDFPCHCI